MMRRTPLKSKKRLQPLSKKMLEQLNNQVPTRIALCERAGGHPVTSSVKVGFNDGSVGILQTVTCFGGICEICHKQAQIVEPHEKWHRSLGGKLSLEKSRMVCRACHIKEHS